jgi:hypothetical protein
VGAKPVVVVFQLVAMASLASVPIVSSWRLVNEKGIAV